MRSFISAIILTSIISLPLSGLDQPTSAPAFGGTFPISEYLNSAGWHYYGTNSDGSCTTTTVGTSFLLLSSAPSGYDMIDLYRLYIEMPSGACKTILLAPDTEYDDLISAGWTPTYLGKCFNKASVPPNGAVRLCRYYKPFDHYYKPTAGSVCPSIDDYITEHFTCYVFPLEYGITPSPTSFPSLQPTLPPSHAPTDHPITTSFPSLQPTVSPTLPPSHVPTFHPTVLPTRLPTLKPTAFPSHFPSESNVVIVAPERTVKPIISTSITSTTRVVTHDRTDDDNNIESAGSSGCSTECYIIVITSTIIVCACGALLGILYFYKKSEQTLDTVNIKASVERAVYFEKQMGVPVVQLQANPQDIMAANTSENVEIQGESEGDTEELDEYDVMNGIETAGNTMGNKEMMHHETNLGIAEDEFIVQGDDGGDQEDEDHEIVAQIDTLGNIDITHDIWT